MWSRLALAALAGWFARPALHYLALSLAVLSAVSTSFGFRDVMARRDDHARLRQQQVVAELDPPLPSGRDADDRFRALRPPEGGAAFVGGLEASLPAYWDFGPSGVEWGPGHQLPQMSAGGVMLDLSGLALLLGGLAISLMTTHRTLARRLDRTWFALANLPVHPRLVGSPKLAATLAAALYPALAAAGAAALTTLWIGEAAIASAPGDLALVALGLAVPMWLYFALMSLAGLGAGLAARREAAAYLQVIAIWSLVALLGPALPLATARLVGDTQSRTTMEFVRSKTFADRLRTAEFALADHVVAQVGDGPEAVDAFVARSVDLIADWWDPHAGEARRLASDLDDRWWQTQARQQRLVAWVAIGSPGFHLIRAMEHLAGTGPAAAAVWHDAVAAHQQALAAALFDDPPRLTLRVRVGDAMSRVHDVDRRLVRLEDLPVFEPPARSLADRARSAAWSLALLGAWVAGAAIWVCVLFRRVGRRSYSLDASSVRP